MKNLQLLALLSLLIFVSCSSQEDVDPIDDDLEGNFEFSLTGEENRSIKGNASFLHGILTSKSEEENGSSLAVNLINDGNEDELFTILIGQLGDLDGINKGAYNIDFDPAEGEPLVGFSAFLNGSFTAYIATSGNISIAKIENKKIEGTISVVLEDLNGKILNVSGKFTALGITENV